jgi:hypothetical protein
MISRRSPDHEGDNDYIRTTISSLPSLRRRTLLALALALALAPRRSPAGRLAHYERRTRRGSDDLYRDPAPDPAKLSQGKVRLKNGSGAGT